MDGIDAAFTGETLRYGYCDVSLGRAIVAVSAKGVAAILLGSDDARLRRDLADAAPGAALVEDGPGLADMLGAVARSIDHPGATPDLALDMRGAADRIAVWEALRAIPAGETRSYGAIGKALAVPMKAKDVGAACAANILAVAVPCHRVVKADGSLAGYRWGVGRKRRLIAMEAGL